MPLPACRILGCQGMVYRRRSEALRGARQPLSDQPAPRDQRASAGTGVQVPDGLQCFAAVRAHSASRSGRAGTHSTGDATGADIPAHYNPDLRPPQAG